MDIQKIKKDFPQFHQTPHLIYLDSAATALTPQCVVEKICAYYTTYNANIARGLYKTSEEATAAYEQSRATVAAFLHAKKDEIVFTSGTTMSINTIANGLDHVITHTDNIITTMMEHHANLIPWQQLCKKTNAQLRIVPLKKDYTLDVDALLKLINHNTKVLTLTHASNVLGCINPIKEIIRRIRAKNDNILIVVDAAQSVAHIPIDVVDIDCDFLAFSFHKLFGPTGVGVLYGKKQHLNTLQPLLTGGEMIENVTFDTTTFRNAPIRFEAGTPHIAGVIASQEALSYVTNIGLTNIHKYEKELSVYCRESLINTFGDAIKIYGPNDIDKQTNVISFTFKNYHPHDIATILDRKNTIAVRAGHHCAMPLHLEVLKINATTRASFSIYNTKEDIDKLIEGLKEVDKILKQDPI